MNQSTQARVASSTSESVFHGPLGWIFSVLKRPIVVSARALSYASPTEPTEAIDAGVDQSSGEGKAGVLAAGVGVMNEPGPDRGALVVA